MIACLDVHYSESNACAAAVVFKKWQAKTAQSEYSASVGPANAYEPGRFYLRELVPLTRVIETIGEAVDVFVIDAYCSLDSDGAPGLGAHLHRALDESVAVVGVAKNRFRNTDHARLVYRGDSSRPLYVTAVGMDPDRAADSIASMSGDYRIPNLMKQADRLSRSQPEDDAQRPI